MTRAAAILLSAALAGCAVPDNVATWHEGCDYSQLAGKTALVVWARDEAEANSACRAHPQYASLPLGHYLGCTMMRPEPTAPGFTHPMWQSIDGIVITTPKAWVALHESCHVALGPSSKNHPPHGDTR
jgi:hypothetical protein